MSEQQSFDGATISSGSRGRSRYDEAVCGDHDVEQSTAIDDIKGAEESLGKGSRQGKRRNRGRGATPSTPCGFRLEREYSMFSAVPNDCWELEGSYALQRDVGGYFGSSRRASSEVSDRCMMRCCGRPSNGARQSRSRDSYGDCRQAFMIEGRS